MKIPDYVIAMLALVLLCSCSEIVWRDNAPKEVSGRWQQVSDEIISGRTKPDSFFITSEKLVYKSWSEDEGIYTEKNLPIKRASISGGEVIVFCGLPDSNHISSRSYKVRLEKDNSFCNISELVATGVNDDDSELYVGRFVLTK